jgi:hypothetical protein
MAVKTWVGRFAIVDGEPQEEGPYLRSFPRQRPDDEEDELYVLVEPAGEPSTEYAQQLADAIGRLYKQDGLSLTGAVLRSIRAAHEQLRDWNRRSLREHHVAASVSCLAVRGRTAYLAQMGETVAYHVGDGRFSRIAPSNGGSEPLGQADSADPAFSRYSLSPGDLILVVPSRTEELVNPDAIRSILLRGGNDALTELFRLARDQHDFSLVLLACVVEPELEEPPAPPPPLEEPVLSVDDVMATTFGAQAAAEAPVDAALTEALGAAQAGTGAPPPGLSQPKVRLREPGQSVRYPRTTGMRVAVPDVPPLAVIALAVIALIGLGGWCVIPSALEESRVDRFDTLVTAAGASLEEARATGDAAQKRQHLDQAEGSLAEAEMLRPDSEQTASLRSELNAAVATLDAVVELPDPALVVDLGAQLPGGAALSELKLGGGGAYFLDRENGRVYAFPLAVPNPQPVPLFESGLVVGTEPVGAPVEIAWAQELNSLMVLDDGRRFIAMGAGRPPVRLTVRDVQALGSIDDMFYGNGNLYLLDKASNQVWRYQATQAGFDSERDPLLGPADISSASELNAVEDVYLLGSGEEIARFQGGARQPFEQAGIDQPVSGPASAIIMPALDRMLVADQGGDRIVVFTLDGRYVKQFKSATFTDLRAINLDRTTNELYILNGNALFKTPLPPLD